MSTLLILAATAALSVFAGRLAAEPQLRRLHRLLALARRAAGHDRLTGLPNRTTAADAFHRREQRSQPTVLVLLDIDHFKQVNDSYGHDTGDELLRGIATRLAAATATHGGIATRLGGDEFVLLLPSVNPDAVRQILNAAATPITLHTDDGLTTLHPSLSAGISVHEGAHDTFTSVLRQADIALYHAKTQRGCVRIYTPDMRMPHTQARHGRRLRDKHPGQSQSDS